MKALRIGSIVLTARRHWPAAAEAAMERPSPTVSFRVARIGGDRLYLRSDTSGGDSRFTLGLHEVATYAAGTFDGRDNVVNQASYSYDGASAVTITLTPSIGATSTITGTAGGLGFGPTGLRGITTAANGSFFSMRGNTLGIVFSARANAINPGYVLLATKR